MKHLVLLTKRYPFDFGEEFLEKEIGYLSEQFDMISIFATDVIDTKTHRELPDNAFAYPFCISKYSLIPSMISCSIKPDKKFVSERDIKNAKKGIKTRLYLSYVISKSKIIYKKIQSICEVKDEDYTVFYSYWLYDTAVACSMLKNSVSCDKKYAVSRAHGYDLYEYRSDVNFLPLREYLFSNLDMIYPCSDNGTDYLKNNFSVDENRIKTSYLGVSDNGEAKYDDYFTIVSCSYISPVKRIDRLAKSLSHLPSEKKYRWIHLGGGDGLAEIQQYAYENLKNIECIFAGNVKNEDITEFYKKNSVNLFINSSSSEGLPVSIMEAESFGIPVIATDVGGTSEIVIDGRTGYLIPADYSDEQLADKILMIENMSEEDYKQLRCNCRQIYLDKFTTKKNYRKFAEEIANFN